MSKSQQHQVHEAAEAELGRSLPYNLWVTYQYRDYPGMANPPERVLIALGPGAKDLHSALRSIVQMRCGSFSGSVAALIDIDRIFEECRSPEDRAHELLAEAMKVLDRAGTGSTLVHRIAAFLGHPVLGRNC
jgi:hypothetical protein